MSITAECTACGRKYEAPANLAGKRVRCKQCGNVFAIPDSASAAELSDLEALAALEKSYHSVDATAAGQAPPSDDQGDEDGEDVAPLRRGRTNVRLNFPLARELDQWLPTVMTLVGLLWLTAICVNFNETSAKWMAYVRLALALLAYVVFIAPITLAMLRRAGKQLGYQLPRNDRGRVFGIYLPAYALGYTLWASSDGQFIALILGCFAGIAIVSAALWLLFRLNPTEIAPSATYALVGFYIGVGITSALFYGLNLLVLQIVLAVKAPDVLPASPVGSGLAWVTEDQKKQIKTELANKKNAAPAPTPSAEPAGVPEPAPAPLPVGPASISPIVRSVETAPITEPFEKIIYPLSDSPFRALSRASGGNTVIDLWDSNSWTQKGSATFQTAGPNEPGNSYVLSPDGKSLAHIVPFPRLCVQVWSYPDRAARLVYFEGDQLAKPELIGFLDPQRLLIRWERNGGYAFEIRDIASSRRVRLINTPVYETKGSAVAISPRGNLAAVATRVENKPTLLVYNLDTGTQISAVQINSLDPQWPVIPTGMAFSLDSRKLAILFEQAGNGLLLAYQIDADRNQASQNAENVYTVGAMPARNPQFAGSALIWLPDHKTCLLYGQGIFDVASGRKLEELRVNNVQTSMISSPNLVELSVRPTANGPRQIMILRLDIDKLASLAR